jgi:Calcineurin-like phosphoesterase
VRTLIISDLHLGDRHGHDVLTRPRPLERLLTALEEVDRLVLLGDTVELMQGRARPAMALAEPVMRALGARVGAGGEVIVVPGNHDLPLVRSWIRENPGRMRPETRVRPDVTPALSALCRWLRPASVQVSYPGVWLSPQVWATHGHYADRHLLPDSAYGISRGLLRRLPQGPASPADYERGRRPSLSRASRWLPRPLSLLLDDAAELLRAATMPRLRRGLLHPRLAPLTASVLGLQVRLAAVPALAHVVQRLGVEAECVVFGHVHRLGPLAGDDAAVWCGPGGTPAILNCGSWLYEPLLIHRAKPPHPYWPGGAVMLADGEDPVAVSLLDELSSSELR